MTFEHDEPPSGALPLLALLNLLLIVVYALVAAQVCAAEEEVALRLPVAPANATAGEARRLPGDVVVNVAADGSLSINGIVLSRDDALRRLRILERCYPDQGVVLRADADTPYAHIADVLSLCREARVRSVSIATRSP